MTKAYREISNDKRHDLIRLIEKTHMSVKKAAEVLQINYSSAKNIVGFFNRTGILEKKPKTGNHTCKKLTDEEISLLRTQISENRRITLDSLKAFVLNEFQKNVSTSAIWNYIKTFRQSFKQPYSRRRRKMSTLTKLDKDINGEEYLITEYPTEDDSFIVAVADSSGQNIFKKSGHMGDKVMLDFCGNTISYLICGRDDEGNIRQTKIFIGVSENNKPENEEINEYQNEQDMFESHVPDQVEQQEITKDNEEEYFISEETVVTNNGRQQMVTLYDKNHKVCDTKYGSKDIIVRLELSDKAFDYTVHGPIVTKLSFDKQNGAVVQEEWKTDLGLFDAKKPAVKRTRDSNEPTKTPIKKKCEPTLGWEDVPSITSKVLPSKKYNERLKSTLPIAVGGSLPPKLDKAADMSTISSILGRLLTAKENKERIKSTVPLAVGGSLASKRKKDTIKTTVPLAQVGSLSPTPSGDSASHQLISSQHNGMVVSTILATKMSPKSPLKILTQPQTPATRQLTVAQHNNKVKSNISAMMETFTFPLTNVVRARKTVKVTTDLQATNDQ